MSGLSFDIFCRVVDNFGDIGVCWRLARQLAHPPYQNKVRLWVDDLRSFSRIEQQIDPHAAQQTVDAVEIVHWTPVSTQLKPHSVVIEAFACDPPPAFVEAMVRENSLWINLEYLSAESWVESCHAVPSMQANGLRKYFFFPGFTPATGGLLREPGLLARREQWLSKPAHRLELLQALGVPSIQLQRLQQGARLAFLFCYPNAPALGLLDSLKQQTTPSVLIAPAGVYPELLTEHSDRVHVHDIPFVNQASFDQLLWSSDLNFVRGEDSLVRALWAGKPLVWQIYAQEEDAHMIKLQAWLERSPYSGQVRELMANWNRGRRNEFALRMNTALQPDNWKTWQADSAKWSKKLSEYPDLAHSLVAFCAQQHRSG